MCQFFNGEHLSAIAYMEEWLRVVYRMFMIPLYEWFCNFRAYHFKNSQKLQF